METKKYSVYDYLEDKSILVLNYIPFDSKLQIVTQIIKNVIDAVGVLNSTLLRRVATETIIEIITNLDLGIKDENGLSGYDQLCYHREFDNLIESIEYEYNSFQDIINEQVSDFIRINNNPNILENKTGLMLWGNAGDSNESE